MKISLCMILWNEAKSIERLIRSAQPFVSEVVVGVDRGSTDGTREIVKRLGCRVLETRLSEELAVQKSVDSDPEWGFSKARNLVLGACDPNAWHLILDGHERFLHGEQLAAEVDTAIAAGCDAVAVTVTSEPGKDGISTLVYDSTRVLAPTVRYSNPLHNAPNAKKKYRSRSIVVERWKSDQADDARHARNVQRAACNIAGFQKIVEKEPKNARAWYYLATAYKESARWADAVKAFEECLKHSVWNEERWNARVEAARCWFGLSNHVEAREQLAAALDEQPERAEAHYYLGDLAYKLRHFREAELWLERCVAMPMPNCRLFLNKRIYLVNRHDALSLVYSHLGKYGQAIEQAELALKAAPNGRIEKNISIWKTRVSNGTCP